MSSGVFQTTEIDDIILSGDRIYYFKVFTERDFYHNLKPHLALSIKFRKRGYITTYFANKDALNKQIVKIIRLLGRQV